MRLLDSLNPPRSRPLLDHAAGRLRAALPEAGLVLLGTTAFVCAFFWPVVAHIGSTIVGFPEGSDSTATIAGFWQMRHEGGYHVVGTIHHTYTGAPFGWTQPSVITTQVLLVYFPTYLLSHVIGTVAAYNVITLVGFALSGLAMYLLVRYLGCAPLVAAWAGLAFIVFPYHLAHQEHASLVHVEVLALLIVALVAVMRRPSWQRFVLLGAANLACWLTSGYFGPMAAIATLSFAVGAALTGQRRHGVRLVLASAAAVVAAGAVIGLDAIASGTDTGAGLERGSSNLSIYGLRPSQLLVPPLGNIVLGNRLSSFWGSRFHGSNATEIISYAGLLTLALAVAWLWLCWRRRRDVEATVLAATVGIAASLLVALAFAAPSPLLVFGHEVSWTPARVLWHIVPAFRIQSRWGFFLMAAFVPLAAMALNVVWRVLAQRRLALAVAAVGAAMAFSFLELAIEPAQPRFRTIPVPPEYAAVELTPPGILVDYPLGYSANFPYWQHVHGRPLLNGGPPDSRADQARLVLLDPAQPGTAPALSLLGVTAIGIHPHANVDAEVLPGDPRDDDGYRLVGRFRDAASIWEVTAPPAPALVTLPEGFGTPRREADGLVVYPLAAQPATLELAAKAPSTVRLVFDAAPRRNRSSVVRITDALHEQAFTVRGRTHISFLVAVPRGRSQLSLHSDALAISAPRAQRARGVARLRAQPLSADPGF